MWSIAFSPDDQTLAMGNEDSTIKLWDLEVRSVRATLTGHRASDWSRVFSRDGKFLATSRDGLHIASGGRDGTVHVWEAIRRGR